MESLFLEPSVSQTSRFLEPNLVSPGFASLKLYNFTPDFSNPRFLETPDNSNHQFWLPWEKLSLDNSNLRKFRNHLVRMSITFTPLNKLTLPDKLLSRILITQQASHKSVISLKRLEGLKLLSQYIDKFVCPLEMKNAWYLHAFAIPKVNSFAFHYSST